MFQRTRKPAFAIAFVTIRSFIPFSQSYSRFGIVSQSSLKVFSRISLQFLKFVGQNLQTEKLSRICRAEWSSRVVEPSCRAELSSRVVEPSFSCRVFRAGNSPGQSSRKVKTVVEWILICQTRVSLRISFQ